MSKVKKATALPQHLTPRRKLVPALPAIPFNYPYLTGQELPYIKEVLANRNFSGSFGKYSQQCQAWFKQQLGVQQVLLTPSGTAALEMAALLIDLKPGDEVIMPAYTFTSTANAFVLRGAIPVFVDIRPDTLNLDESKIEAAITPKTRVIVPVHYGGIGCAMDTIMAIAKKHKLWVVEDAAHAVLSTYRGKALGSYGHLAALSFHETKTLMSGEGGALLINDPALVSRAEILQEKGTNRSRFFRGEVDKYTWMDVGSSFLTSELTAAFLWAQLEQARVIIRQRQKIWASYHRGLAALEKIPGWRLPRVPEECTHDAHLYYLLLPNVDVRTEFIKQMKGQGIGVVFHYLPLHLAPAGKKFGRAAGLLPVTVQVSDTLVRLPLWLGVEKYQTQIIHQILLVANDLSCAAAK